MTHQRDIQIEDEDDGLDGADQIAAYLRGILGPRWTRRRVYEVANKGGMPIVKVAGAGLTARKSKLLAHLEAEEDAAVSKRKAS